MTNKHTFKTMNLHNRYLSVIALNLCKQLIIISGIFARLALINCIGSKDRAHMVTILLFVAGSIFMENLLNLAGDAQKLWITRKHSLKAREMVALKLAGLPLSKLEEHGIQEMPEKVEDYLKRSLDYSMAVSNFISFGVLAGTLLFLLKAVPFYVVLLLAAFMAAGFISMSIPPKTCLGSGAGTCPRPAALITFPTYRPGGSTHLKGAYTKATVPWTHGSWKSLTKPPGSTEKAGWQDFEGKPLSKRS